ncbi:hypothetical protein FUA23_03875 [Neolewinella aurantiaca]|uniref:Sulfotransferase family protein n=1 Tax=Neolewinella aurantiaca TaxID=2602767 RepID=A0A5C7FSC6_9BACT|nr:hypothetical protein [Neolewinella aurantiaca]TXF90948.1 hypothetical protein FUA23_03875 [Neolewinella aurantiaca]
MMRNKVLMLLGMHRSGTSLMGQWLANCGLHLGEEMLGKSASNKFGHFEDRDFLEFHRALLAHNNLDYDVGEKMSIEIPTEFEVEAEKLIEAKNNENGQWGWKEPRTCLFLDFWDEKIPGAKSLVIYRDYENVVDSLLRRYFHKYDHRRNFILKFWHRRKVRRSLNDLANHFLRVWINYNEHLISYVIRKQAGEDYLLISHSDFLEKSDIIVRKLVQDWGFQLDLVGIESVYKARELSKGARFDVNYKKQNVDDAKRVLNKLSQLRTLGQ